MFYLTIYLFINLVAAAAVTAKIQALDAVAENLGVDAANIGDQVSRCKLKIILYHLYLSIYLTLSLSLSFSLSLKLFPPSLQGSYD